MGTTTAFDIDKMFEDKAPTEEQKEKIENVKAAARSFAKVVLYNVPDCYGRRMILDEVKRCFNSATTNIINNT